MLFENKGSRSDLLKQIRCQTDDGLLTQLSRLRSIEKSTVADILLYLREVERRGLHLQRGYSGLYEFCLQELGYNKDEAYYRISAMKLIQDIPEVESELRKGSLSLTVAAKAQIAFRREEKRRKEEQEAPLLTESKREVLKELAQCSKKEGERTLATHFPHIGVPEKTQALSADRTLIQFSVDQGLMNKLEKLKSLTAHKNPEGDWEGLISELADMALKKLDPDLKKTTSSSQSSSKPFVPARKAGRSSISVTLKRKLWMRAQGQCEFVDLQSGRRCSSRHLLELDHKWPKALGGEDGYENLRWFCRSHNVFAAQEALGTLRSGDR